jgi:hypothetical protein
MPSGDRITAKSKKVVRKKKGAAEVEQAAKQVQAFVKRPVKIKAEPRVREVKKIAAVKIARSGEQQARKLPVAKPKSRKELDSMTAAVRNRQTRPRNKSASAAIDALNERTTQRIALSSPKRAQQIVVKDALRGVMSDVNRGVQSRGTPVKGKARKEAIEDLTSGKTRRIKSVGPFTRRQLEDEGAVKRSTTNSQLPSALRKTRYKKPATTPIGKAIEKGVTRADPGALKLLDLAARPFYAGASAAKAAAEGKDVLAGAKRGVTGKEKASYRDVLKKAGAPKIVSDVVGTGADFILDPVNLVSAGSASTARKAGEAAAKSAAKKGLAESAVRKAKLTAMREVEDTGKNRIGLDLKVAGKSVPGVRKVVSKKVNIEKEQAQVAKVKRKPSPRNVAHEVSPRVRPKGMRESDHVSYRERHTDARAARDEWTNEARRYSRSAGLALKDEDTARIFDKIERGKINELPAREAAFAERLVTYMKTWEARRAANDLNAKIGGKHTVVVPKVTAQPAKAAKAVETARTRLAIVKQHGTVQEQADAVKVLKKAQSNASRVKAEHARQTKAKHEAEKNAPRYEGMAEQFLPHFRATELRGQGLMSKVTGSSRPGKKVTEPSRKDLRPASVKNAERDASGQIHKKVETVDIPLVMSAYGQQQAHKNSRAMFNKGIADDAPKYKPGEKLGARDGVFEYKDGSLRELDEAEIATAAKKGRDDLVRLDREAYDRFVKDLEPLDRVPAGEAFDRANAAWKRLALATPGFYTRNFIGEATMGFMGTKGALGTPRYIKAGAVDSRKILRRTKQRERAELGAMNPDVVPMAKTTKTIKVGGKKRNLDEYIDELRADGTLRSGDQGRGVRQQADAGDITLPTRKPRMVYTRERALRAAADVEDFWKIASRVAFENGGMTRTEARRRALDFHFDYGELSKFERQARRVLPFYTFNSRALEMYLRSAVTRPGKLSSIEKTRETVQDLTGAGEDWKKGAKEYQERSVPLIAQLGGRDMMLSAALPVSILNEAPLGLIEAASKLVQGDVDGAIKSAVKDGVEWSFFLAGLTTPFIKSPVEYNANHSFFFRGPIAGENRQLVAAPQAFAFLKGTPLGELMGITDKYLDTRTQNTTLGYNAKADYLVRQIPGIPALLLSLSQRGTDRRGRGQAEKVIGALTGLKVEPVDPANASFEDLYDEKGRVESRQGELRQMEGGKDSDEYKENAARLKEIGEAIGAAKDARGDVRSKPKRKVRKRKQDAGFSFGGGSGSSSSSPSSSGSSSGFTFGG